MLLEGGHYRFCRGITFLADADEFDLRCDGGRSLERRNLTEAAIAEYERAVDLYRGDYLSEDLYEEWTMIERQRLANSYVEVLDRLSRHYAETEQYASCVRTCYKILEKEPYYENGQRLLMYSNARLGLRNRVLQQYRVYEQTLSNRFGAEPSAEIKALYRSILRGGGHLSSAGSP